LPPPPPPPMLLAKLRPCTDIILELLTHHFYGITQSTSLSFRGMHQCGPRACPYEYVSLLGVEVGQPCCLLRPAPYGSILCANFSYKHRDALGINLEPICSDLHNIAQRYNMTSS